MNNPNGGWKQFWNRCQTYFISHPEWMLSVAGVVLFVMGQGYIFSTRLKLGILLTTLACALLLIQWLAGAKLSVFVKWSLSALKQAAERWQAQMIVRSQTDGISGSPIPGVEPSADQENLPVVPTASIPPPMGKWQEFSNRTVVLSKKILMLFGGLLILAAQPFLLKDAYTLGVPLVVIGLVLLVNVLFYKQENIVLGKIGTLLKFTMMLLPGVALLLAGNVILIKWVSISKFWEVVGLGLNAAGIFLIYALFPRVLEDPDPDGERALDAAEGKAKNMWGVWLKVALVIVACGIYFMVRNAYGPTGSAPTAILVIVGLGIFLLSFPWAKQTGEPKPAPQPLTALVIKGLRLLAFVLAMYLAYQGQLLLLQEQLYPGLYRYLLASIILLFAFRESVPTGVDTLKDGEVKWYWEVAGLLVILTFSVWVRLYLLDRIPYGIECDEAGSGVAAIKVLQNQLTSFVVAKDGGRPLFMVLPRVVGFHLFGINPTGLKFDSMVWGVFGVLTLYLMARHMFGVKAAMGAAALMAVSRWHIHFSRYGWSNMLMVLLLTLAFYFLIKGLSNRKKGNFLLSGMAMSLCVQTETAARMLPIICAAVLVYLLFFHRRFIHRNWKPLTVLFLGVWLGGAGIFSFWIQKPQFLIKRVYEVSMFSEDANAPKDLAQGLIVSTKFSLTQLNWHGDYRTRHNGGMSGEPVLDFWTSILFALGFGYALYYWRRMRYFILYAVFFGFMCASVFSLEAPQSHRAFGVIFVAFLFIAAFLDRTRRLLQSTLGKGGVAAAGLAFVVALVPIGNINYHKYFDTEPAFDSNCTLAARYMGEKWRDAHHYVMSAYLWMGHPPFEFYAPNIDGQFYYQPSQIAPVIHPVKKDVLYTFILEYPPVLELAKWFYPEGIYSDETHPKYGLMYRSWGVKKEEIEKKWGLTASYYNNTEWQGKPALVRKDATLDTVFTPETWPLKGPGSVAWEGTIYIPHEGNFTFYAYGDDSLTVEIGDRIVLQAGGKQETQKTVWVAGGLHSIRARARYVQKQSRILLAWSAPNRVLYYLYGSPYQDKFFKQPVPFNHFFVYPKPIGLLETMYPSANWTGKPLRQFVEPAPFFFWHSLPHGFEPPLSYDWRGTITIPDAGEYRFEMMHSGYGELRIGDKTVILEGPAPAGETTTARPTNPVVLPAGTYPLLMKWSANSGWGFQFWWTPPSGKRELVPGWLMSPAKETEPR